jgi:hypothetical protein
LAFDFLRCSSAFSGSVRLAHSSLDGLVGNLHFLIPGRPVLLRPEVELPRRASMAFEVEWWHSAAQRNAQVLVRLSVPLSIT